MAGPLWLRLEGVGILASDGVDAEVPDGEIDGFVGEDFQEGEFAELQVLIWSDLHPVATGEDFGFGLDEIDLVASGAEETDLEAIDDAGAGSDVGAKDDVGAGGCAAVGGVRRAIAGAVGVDGERLAAGGG